MSKDLERFKDCEHLLFMANAVMRSAHEIAERRGQQTNWTAFQEALAEQLAEQHRYMHQTYHDEYADLVDAGGLTPPQPEAEE